MEVLHTYTSIGVPLLILLLWLAWRSLAAGSWRAFAIVLVMLIIWVPFEVTRPFVGHGYVTGTEVRRVPNPQNPNTTDDVDHVYIRGWGGDEQYRNEDSPLFLKWNTDDLYGYAKSIEGKPAELRTYVATGARSFLLSWHPNILSLRPSFIWVTFVAHYLFWLVVFTFLMSMYREARRGKPR
jgi:hypothetical protein